MIPFSSIENALDALSRGRMIIVVDAEHRENEGDLLVAAEKVSPAIVHFMITHGRGQVCMPVAPEIADRLDLQPMVPQASLDMPRFAIPLDHLSVGSGISPRDRALTIQTMVDPDSRPEDFLRPGHIFPLIARPGGVLRREGHTEAAVDLALLAGCEPAGVLCEVCSNDGVEMACNNELTELARCYHMPIISIEALVEYRRKHAVQYAQK